MHRCPDPALPQGCRAARMRETGEGGRWIGPPSHLTRRRASNELAGGSGAAAIYSGGGRRVNREIRLSGWAIRPVRAHGPPSSRLLLRGRWRTPTAVTASPAAPRRHSDRPGCAARPGRPCAVRPVVLQAEELASLDVALEDRHLLAADPAPDRDGAAARAAGQRDVDGGAGGDVGMGDRVEDGRPYRAPRGPLRTMWGRRGSDARGTPSAFSACRRRPGWG